MRTTRRREKEKKRNGKEKKRNGKEKTRKKILCRCLQHRPHGIKTLRGVVRGLGGPTDDEQDVKGEWIDVCFVFPLTAAPRHPGILGQRAIAELL